MDTDFWHRRWMKNEIGFHKDEVHHFLQRFLPELKLPDGARILVPLCGKSLDMLWLCEQGYEVIGVELSRSAIEKFCQENSLQPQISETVDLRIYQLDRLTIYCGDLFSLTTRQTGHIDAVYDRGSLVALPPSMQEDYARKLCELLDSGSQILAISYDYDQAQRPGPPFSVPQAQLERLFGTCCSVTRLHSESTIETHQMLKAAGLQALQEDVYLLDVR